jgi:glycosyltransferase involved in cell wall biosynthesis
LPISDRSAYWPAVTGSLTSQFVLPIVSHNEGAGKDSSLAYKQLLLLTTFASIGAFVILGMFGQITAPILWGRNALGITNYLAFYCLAMVYFTITNTIIVYHQAKKKYEFQIAGFLFSFIQIAGLIFYHENLAQITTVFLGSSVMSLTGILILQFTSPYIYRLGQKLSNRILGETTTAPYQKSILIFNWRDTRHIWGGGAEVYIQELAKRWVEEGCRVTIFCGNDRKNPRHETIDGVEIYRRGGFFLVYLWAPIYYFLKFRKKYETIIDCENGIPFFTPLYAGSEKKYLLIHHVHQEIFRKGLPYPAFLVASFLEQILMPFVYRKIQVLTVSPSSKADILGRRMTNKEPIIIYNGVDLKKLKPGKKTAHPTILYLGRLKDYKSIPVLLKSAKNIITKIPTAKFIIAGDGPEKKRLMRITNDLKITSNVEFTGKVTEQEKIALYQKAWVFVNPSLMEGWGITSIEANACGTPVIGSNVPGLSDSIKNPHSGLLVPYGNTDEFTKAILKLVKNDRIRKQMEKDSLEWANKYDWANSAKSFLALI